MISLLISLPGRGIAMTMGKWKHFYCALSRALSTNLRPTLTTSSCCTEGAQSGHFSHGAENIISSRLGTERANGSRMTVTGVAARRQSALLFPHSEAISRAVFTCSFIISLWTWAYV